MAEILRSLVPLMNGVGIRAHWTSITGPPSFYDVTKTIHNLLQGLDGELGGGARKHYEETVDANAAVIDLKSDVVVVHDPQPLPSDPASQRPSPLDLALSPRPVHPQPEHPRLLAADGRVITMGPFLPCSELCSAGPGPDQLHHAGHRSLHPEEPTAEMKRMPGRD